MTFKERQRLREEVAVIQRKRERHARRLEIVTTYGEHINMGGGCRPIEEQCRSGYPPTPTEDDNSWIKHNQKKVA